MATSRTKCSIEHQKEAIAYIEAQPLKTDQDLDLERIELMVKFHNDDKAEWNVSTKEKAIHFIENLDKVLL